MSETSRRPTPCNARQRGRLFFAVGAMIGSPSLAACHMPAPRQSTADRLAIPAAEGESEVRPFVPPIALAADPREDAIVRIVGPVACSGVLVDEDLVLTAHHCVSRRENGKVQRADLEPKEVSIELGGDDLPWGEVGVRAIVAPSCGYVSGEGDIAILVLDRKLVGMPVADVRMHEPPGIGERVSPWGFGRCAMQGGDAIHRVTREGRGVSAVTAEQVVADASICPGDSGGPVFGENGHVIGVVSASVMDADARTIAPSLFTRVDVWTAIFSAARAIGDGSSMSELPPFRSCSHR